MHGKNERLIHPCATVSRFRFPPSAGERVVANVRTLYTSISRQRKILWRICVTASLLVPRHNIAPRQDVPVIVGFDVTIGKPRPTPRQRLTTRCWHKPIPASS